LTLTGPQGPPGPSGALLSNYAPLMGTTIVFIAPNLNNTKVFNIYASVSNPSNRYTIIKTTNDTSTAGAYGATRIIPTASMGAFILGRAIANGPDNIVTFGFLIGNDIDFNSNFTVNGQTPPALSTSSVKYGFHISPVTGSAPQNIDVMNLQIIVGGAAPIKPSSTFYNPTSTNPAVYISAADRLTVAFNGVSMNYFVNGIQIHTATLTSTFVLGVTELYSVVTLNNGVNSSNKQCAVVDFQMGTYDYNNVPALIIGGKPKRSSSIKKVNVPPVSNKKGKAAPKTKRTGIKLNK